MAELQPTEPELRAHIEKQLHRDFEWGLSSKFYKECKDRWGVADEVLKPMASTIKSRLVPDVKETCRETSTCFGINSQCKCFRGGRPCDRSGPDSTCSQCKCKGLFCLISSEEKACISRGNWVEKECEVYPGLVGKEYVVPRDQQTICTCTSIGTCTCTIVGIRQAQMEEVYGVLKLPQCVQVLDGISTEIKKLKDEIEAAERDKAANANFAYTKRAKLMKVYYGEAYQYYKDARSNGCSRAQENPKKCKECCAKVCEEWQTTAERITPIPDWIKHNFIGPLENVNFVEKGSINSAQIDIYEDGQAKIDGHFDSCHFADPTIGVISIRLLRDGKLKFNVPHQHRPRNPTNDGVKTIELPKNVVTKIKEAANDFVNHSMPQRSGGGLSASIILRRVYPRDGAKGKEEDCSSLPPTKKHKTG